MPVPGIVYHRVMARAYSADRRRWCRSRTRRRCPGRVRLLLPRLMPPSPLAAEHAGAAEASSVNVATLAEGVLKVMLLIRLKMAAAVLLTVFISMPGLSDETKEKDAKKALDALQGDWRVTKLDID